MIAAIVRVLERPDHAVGLCAGAWLALAGAVLILAGAWWSIRDERGALYAPAEPDTRPRPSDGRPARAACKAPIALVAGGAIALFVFMFFFDWFGENVSGTLPGSNLTGASTGYSGWDTFTDSRWIWLLTIVVALASVASIAAGGRLRRVASAGRDRDACSGCCRSC